MFGTHDFLLFVAAGVLLNITPGPDMLYIIGRSAAQGARAGAAAALGIGAGCVVHTLAAALGVSAVLAASATAFAILQYVGAAYLVYVGISLLRTPTASSPANRTAAPALVALRSVFAQGFLTNVLNPKVALFFLAFLPQFIDADAPSKPLALLFLGAVFNLNGMLWNLFIAWSAARVGAGMKNSRATAWFNRCIGGFFVCLGLRLAFARQG